MKITRINADTSALEKQIDEMVGQGAIVMPALTVKAQNNKKV